MQFNKDGKFKLLVLADPQDGYPLEQDMTAFFCEALDLTRPDLVVFLGDMIAAPKLVNSNEEYLKAYDELLTPLTERGIPFSLVFGNHDQEKMPSTTKEEKLAKYMSYKGCLAYDAEPSLHGCATHNIEIKSSDGSCTAFNLWFMDSGEYAYDSKGNKYYDCVRKNQIDWYLKKSAELERANGKKVSSFMFQHIVPADVAKQVMVTLPFHIGRLARTNLNDGTAVTYLPNIFGFESGFPFECLGNSRDNEGQWDALAERGDVLACFFGHDHKNTYCARVKGVDAVAVHSCTYKAYHDNTHQGALLLTLDESTPSEYKAEYIYTNDIALREGSRLPLLSRDKRDYEKSRSKRLRLHRLLSLRARFVSLLRK